MSLNRTLAGLIDTAGDVKSASLDNVSAGLTVYATLDDLPTTGLTSGDQAYVSATSRFYISNGSGWYNVALVNATPALTVDPTGTIILAQDGSTSSVITLTGTDSDYPDANLTYSVESDGNFGGLATISQDSSVFTITPLSQDSATTSSATLTFKASDGISFGSASRSFSLSFTTQNSSKTMSLIKADTSFNDNQVDASSNSHTITEVGNVTSTALSPYHPGGYSAEFVSGINYIHVDNDVSSVQWMYNGSTAEGTFEAWIYQTAQGTGSTTYTYPCILGNGPTYFNFGVDNAQLKFYQWHGSQVYYTPTGATISLNKWHHVAFSNDSSNNFRIFLDGVLVHTVASWPGVTWANTANSDEIYIGTEGHNAATSSFTGYIRDARMIQGTALYTSTFTPPTGPLTAITNTEWLFCHAPYIKDGSTNNVVVTDNYAVRTKRFAPYDYLPYTRTDHGGSVYFDGTGDYLTTPTSTDFAYGTGDFTIEAWVNIPSAPSNYKYILGQATVSTGLGLYIQSGVYKLYGGSALIVQSSIGYETNVWEHIAIARSGTTLKMFLNGAEVGSVTNSLNFASGSSNGLTIGRWLEAPDPQTWLGYIADVRVVKGTAVYTSAFTPPTAPLTAITNTSLLTCTNKNDIIDVAGGSIITKTGQTTTSDVERKWSTISSTYHQGSADYYSFTLPQPLGNDFTVEMWVNHTSWSDNVGIWDFSGAYGLGAFGSRLKWWDQGNPPEYTIHENSEMDALAGTWWHFALCRTGGNSYKAFINGSLEGSWTLSGGISQTIRIGNDQYGKDLLGYVQDVRVTNGLARYTAAFTPPTAEFDG